VRPRDDQRNIPGGQTRGRIAAESVAEENRVIPTPCSRIDTALDLMAERIRSVVHADPGESDIDHMRTGRQRVTYFAGHDFAAQELQPHRGFLD